jgi:outer membrane protein assembly factor BamB
MAGNVICARQQNFHGIPSDMSIDVNGMIYVLYTAAGGVILGKYDSDGNPVPHPYPPGNPAFDKSNNLYLTGSSQLRKFDIAGTLLWSKFASEEAQLVVDQDQRSYLLTPYTAIQSWLDCFRADGATLWQVDLPISARVAPSIEGKNLYVAGLYCSGSTAKGVEISKLNPSTGSIIWSVKVPCDEARATSLVSWQGSVYVSYYSIENNVAYIGKIQDLSYIPVTTSLAGYNIQNNLLLSPNPCNGAFTFRYSAGQHGKIRINIRDATGRSVLSRDFAAFSNEVSETINIASLPPGMYVFELQNGDAGMVRKLVVQ